MIFDNRPPLSRTDKLCAVILVGAFLAPHLACWAMDAAAERAVEEDKPPAEIVAVAPPIDYAPLVETAEKAAEDAETKRDNDTMFALARTVWGEARGCTTTEQAAVVWCVLNRVDSPDFPDDILEVLEQPNQFSGYGAEYPVWPEILALVEDVLDRWELEKTAVGDVGRVLPEEYVFFEADNQHNYFRTEYRGGTIWDWSLDSPYEGEDTDDSIV